MDSICPLVGISCDQVHTALAERIDTSWHAHDLKEKCSAVPVLRGHSQDESDEAADENGKYEAPDNEEQGAPAANEMVVNVFLVTCSSRGARVVDGENSEQRVEEQATNGEPHIGSRVFDWLRRAGIRARDDAALCQTTRAAWRTVEAATAATFGLRARLLRCHEITRASAFRVITHFDDEYGVR